MTAYTLVTSADGQVFGPDERPGAADRADDKADRAVGADVRDAERATERHRAEQAPDGRRGRRSPEPNVRDLVDVPAAEVIARVAVMLMSAAAEQLGLGSDDPGRPPHRDLDQARTLITALAGLVNAATPDLGPHAAAFRDGLAGLRGAFREFSVLPDPPGRGPGEQHGDARE